jgi:hypothetical protein
MGGAAEHGEGGIGAAAARVGPGAQHGGGHDRADPVRVSRSGRQARTSTRMAWRWSAASLVSSRIRRASVRSVAAVVAVSTSQPAWTRTRAQADASCRVEWAGPVPPPARCWPGETGSGRRRSGGVGVLVGVDPDGRPRRPLPAWPSRWLLARTLTWSVPVRTKHGRTVMGHARLPRAVRLLHQASSPGWTSPAKDTTAGQSFSGSHPPLPVPARDQGSRPASPTESRRDDRPAVASGRDPCPPWRPSCFLEEGAGCDGAGVDESAT